MSGVEGIRSWDTLPSVIMLEIFSYLEPKDRINASNVCKNWRQSLFHPSFWKDITFVFEDHRDIRWTRYLAECFALSVQTATIRCHTPHWSPDMSNLLESFQENRNLRKLFLEPTSSTFEWTLISETASGIWTERIYESLQKIIETSKRLEALTLGCNEELAVHSEQLLTNLAHHHSKHLTHLGLASVKEDPESYDYIAPQAVIFGQFKRLVILTLDYDYLSDNLLDSLTSGTLERLVIHVHHWRSDHPGTTNTAWQRFSQFNKNCELRLTLLHAYAGVTVLDTEILQPAMPLTHYKALFCEYVNLHGFLKLYSWYDCSLKSLIMIDTIDRDELVPLTNDGTIAGSADMLVLVAWRCRFLSELVWIGHKYYQENLLAIVRLRGHHLKRLEIAESDIVSDNEAEFRKTKSEIRKILGKDWKPFTDEELTPVIVDAISGDSRDVIMPMVLKDAK